MRATWATMAAPSDGGPLGHSHPLSQHDHEVTHPGGYGHSSSHHHHGASMTPPTSPGLHHAESRTAHSRSAHTADSPERLLVQRVELQLASMLNMQKYTVDMLADIQTSVEGLPKDLHCMVEQAVTGSKLGSSLPSRNDSTNGSRRTSKDSPAPRGRRGSPGQLPAPAGSRRSSPGRYARMMNLASLADIQQIQEIGQRHRVPKRKNSPKLGEQHQLSDDATQKTARPGLSPKSLSSSFETGKFNGDTQLDANSSFDPFHSLDQRGQAVSGPFELPPALEQHRLDELSTRQRVESDDLDQPLATAATEAPDHCLVRQVPPQLETAEQQDRASSCLTDRIERIVFERRRILTARFNNSHDHTHTISTRRGSKVSAGSAQSMQSLVLRRCLPLNPSGLFRMSFDLISMLLLLYDMVTVPYVIAWGTELTGFLRFVSWFIVGFWTLDILLNLMTGYVDGDQVVMHPFRIVRRYLRTYFVLDILVVGLDVAGLAFEAEGPDSGGSGVHIAKMGRLFKFGRLLRVLAMFRQGRLRRTYSWLVGAIGTIASPQHVHFSVRVFNLLFIIIYLNHFGCCVWFAVGQLPPMDTGMNWHQKLNTMHEGEFGAVFSYTTGFYWSVSAMFSGSSALPPTNSVESLFAAVVVITGLIFSSWLVSTLAATLIQFKSMNQDRTERMQQLQKFLHQAETAPLLAVRVQRQVEERESNTKDAHITYKQVQALSLLSAGLRKELLGNIYGAVLQGNALFRKSHHCLDDQLLADICSTAASFEGYLPGEVVFRGGVREDHMFFVAWGSLEYSVGLYTNFGIDPMDDEDCKIVEVAKGASACELALFVRYVTRGMLEVTMPCELVLVGAEEFAMILKDPKHMEVQKFIRRYIMRLCDAIEAEQPQDFDDLNYGQRLDLDVIMTQMPLEYRVEMSKVELDAMQRKNFFSGFKKFEDLKEEVERGVCHLTQNSAGKCLRVVQVVVLRITRRCDKATFVEVLNPNDGRSVHHSVALPATKVSGQESPGEAARRLLACRLPVFQEMQLGAPSVTWDIRSSRTYDVPTKYIKHEFTAEIEDSQMRELSATHELRRPSLASLAEMSQRLGTDELFYVRFRPQSLFRSNAKLSSHLMIDEGIIESEMESSWPAATPPGSTAPERSDMATFAWMPVEKLNDAPCYVRDGSKEESLCASSRRGSDSSSATSWGPEGTTIDVRKSKAS